MSKTPAQKQADIRRARKQGGMCTACGQHPPVCGRVKCVSCSDKDAAYRAQHKAEKRLTYLAYYTGLKDAAFSAYGGYKCACCGETTIEFLSLDHVAGGGNAHRVSVSGTKSGGGRIYLWLKRNGYPSGYQVLCMNCNFGRSMNNGICPHVTNAARRTIIVVTTD